MEQKGGLPLSLERGCGGGNGGGRGGGGEIVKPSVEGEEEEDSVGPFWRLSWSPLGAVLGGLGVLLRLFWGPLGALWGVLGLSWGSFGASWGALGALLGLSWGSLGSYGAPPGAMLETIDQRRGGPRFPPPSGATRSPLGAFLGRF